LVVVRIAPSSCGRDDADPRTAGGGRPETDGHRRHNQRRILERFAYMAFQAAKVGAYRVDAMSRAFFASIFPM
jgi:hypothetical protein